MNNKKIIKLFFYLLISNLKVSKFFNFNFRVCQFECLCFVLLTTTIIKITNYK